MTSQRDETTPRPAGEDVADDPIIIERRDEFLTGEEPAPAGDGEAYDPAASDELVGRHASPDTSGMDPAPLVVPAESATPDSATPDSAQPEPDTGASKMDPPETRAFQARSPGMDSPTAYDPATSGPATSSAPAALDEPGTDEPGAPETPEPAGSGPAAGVTGVTGVTGAGIPAATLSEQQWPAIQAMFVDDPKGSVQRAAAAADEVVKAFVASIGREQAALHAAWQNDATTEDLRTALQQYRAFCGRLEGLA